MFDIHAGDVVGERHDLVAVELFRVLLGQGGAFDLLHDAGDEVAGSGEGVEYMDAGVGERLAELLLEDFVDAAGHKVDDGLRGVDDAVGVGAFSEERVEGGPGVALGGVAVLFKLGERRVVCLDVGRGRLEREEGHEDGFTVSWRGLGGNIVEVTGLWWRRLKAVEPLARYPAGGYRSMVCSAP